jgi:hypothetical protein
MILQRQGDYTRVLRFFTKGYMWVAEANDRLTGSISWSWRTASINGKPEKLGWLTDTRIHPDYQKTSLIFRLLRKAYQQGCTDNVDITLGTTLEGNDAIGNHQFYIQATPERLCRILDLAEGMRLEDYMLAFRNGQPIAVVHTWDQDSFKQAVVQAYQPYHDVITRITRLLNRFTSLPGLPRPGGTLRYLWLRDLACAPGHESDLKRLVRHTYRKVKQPYHFITAAHQDGDPLAAVHRGIFRTRITMNLWACSLNGRDIRADITPSGKRLFHDFSLT